MTTPRSAVLDLGVIDAVVLDTDGVITDTACTHAAAWKRAFDELLLEQSSRVGAGFLPFDIGSDYPRFVDGRSREDGARGFLRSRGIVLPEQGSDDTETLESLLGRKNRYFLEDVRRHGVRAYPSTVALLRTLRDHGTGIAAVSASRNCGPVLRAAGVDALVDVRVDGLDAERLGLPGKPEPALFIEAARRLTVAPRRCALIEDALVGIEAGDRGGFGLVIGVDRHHRIGDDMAGRGAHVVVDDLADLTVTGRHDGARNPVV